jgi:hypothetical protein
VGYLSLILGSSLGGPLPQGVLLGDMAILGLLGVAAIVGATWADRYVPRPRLVASVRSQRALSGQPLIASQTPISGSQL